MQKLLREKALFLFHYTLTLITQVIHKFVLREKKKGRKKKGSGTRGGVKIKSKGENNKKHHIDWSPLEIKIRNARLMLPLP